MTRVLVTGADGFLGRNLIVALRRLPGLEVLTFDRNNASADLEQFAVAADVVFHLAGVNRPERVEEFTEGNSELTAELVRLLCKHGRQIPVVLPSSTQAALNNPYGRSKLAAEEAVHRYGRETGAPALVYRLPGLFGKWCRPHYNSVVATFCHNVSRGLDITISDPARELELAYIDDVVAEFLKAVNPGTIPSPQSPRVEPTFRVTLGDLARRLYVLRDIRATLTLPDLSDGFTRRLYATFVAYLPEDAFAYQPEKRSDARGSLAELLKSPSFGQIFVSRSNRGVVRGHHYHDSKVEKFCVVQGMATVRLRQIIGGNLLTYRVVGEDMKIVDIPPGYTHSIENIGEGELVVLFWASELFDSARPDTFSEKV